MLIANSFTVDAGPDEVYQLMLDIERVAPCIPGAELVGRRDDGTYDAKVGIKMGPLTLSYKGSDARRAIMHAKAAEQRGQGQAQAKMTMHVEPTDAGGSDVTVESDILVTGRVAQMGRGIMEDVARRMMGDMARCIEAKIAAQHEPGGGADIATGPVGGIGLAAGVIWDRVRGKKEGEPGS
jgi:carbon monoxide dehydrogenase subunit G